LKIDKTEFISLVLCVFLC